MPKSTDGRYTIDNKIMSGKSKTYCSTVRYDKLCWVWQSKLAEKMLLRGKIYIT